MAEQHPQRPPGGRQDDGAAAGRHNPRAEAPEAQRRRRESLRAAARQLVTGTVKAHPAMRALAAVRPPRVFTYEAAKHTRPGAHPARYQAPATFGPPASFTSAFHHMTYKPSLQVMFNGIELGAVAAFNHSQAELNRLRKITIPREL